MPDLGSALTIADASAVIDEAGFGRRAPGVGLELEWFVTRAGEPVSDIAAIRATLERHGPLPHGSRITFEPGGQLEISAPPSSNGPDAVRGAELDAGEVMIRLAEVGMHCVAGGLDATLDRECVLDEPRYQAMARYFAAQGSAGAAMMCTTASLQVNVGFLADAETQWELAHDLAPILAAMFAHSPLVAGRPSGWQSSRLAVWSALDPSRTRPVASDDDARTSWTRYALDAPMMLIRSAERCVVPDEPMTLRSWIENGHPAGAPDADAVAYHLTTLFPPIRPRGWLELRMIDALPHPWYQVAAAVSITTLSDPELGVALAPIVRGCRDLWLMAAWRGIHDPTIGATACAVLDLTLPALERAGYDPGVIAAAHQFADRYPRNARSLADDRLDAWSATGAVLPAAEPIPVTTR